MNALYSLGFYKNTGKQEYPVFPRALQEHWPTAVLGLETALGSCKQFLCMQRWLLTNQSANSTAIATLTIC